MAEADSSGCRCTNISIMQLFHQLKQRFPKVPDQVVSTIIQQNYHNKDACETLLQKESNYYMQCYPGALISGDNRPEPQGPLLDRCSARNAEIKVAQKRADTGSYETSKLRSLQPSVADRAVSAVLPSSQKQILCDVKLPLSAAHVSVNSTPRHLTSSLLTNENDLSTTDCNSIKSVSNPNSGKSTASNHDDYPSKFSSAYQTTKSHDRESHPSLEEKAELSKIPVGKLIREAREKVIDRENSEKKKGCDLTCSECELCRAGACQAVPDQHTLGSLNQFNAAQNVSTPMDATSSKPLDDAIDLIAPVPYTSPEKNELDINGPQLLHCDTSPDRSRRHPSPARQPEVFPSSYSSPKNTLNKAPLLVVPSPNRLSLPPLPDISLKSSFRLDPLSPRSSHHTSPLSLSPVPEEKDTATESQKEYEVAVECVVLPAPGDQQRSFTSVNLTLRPPSAETTLPIDISSGQSLTYTSASFDPRQGYQSHLQIRIGPAGGSMTACRTRLTSPIVHTSKRSRSRSCCSTGTSSFTKIHQQCRALLQQQRERRDMLARELKKRKERLRAMEAEVEAMKLALLRAASTPLVLSKLKADIERLRGECERLTAAVDLFSVQDNRSNLPLGETDEDFYRNIYTGQRQQRAGWSCRVCTFRNHPLLNVCEECEMPRLSLGTTPGHPDLPSRALPNPVCYNNNSSICAAGETSTSVSHTITPLQER